MDFNFFQAISNGESLYDGRTSRSEQLHPSQPKTTNPPFWAEEALILPADDCTDPNPVTSSFPPALMPYKLPFSQDHGYAATRLVSHYEEEEQGTAGYSANNLSQQQFCQPIAGLGMDVEEYHGLPLQNTVAPTEDAAKAFRWTLNSSTVSDQVDVPPRGANVTDMSGLGALFPQDEQALQQNLNDADLGNVNPRLYRAQSSPQLAFRTVEDYPYPTPYDRAGDSKSLSVPGPRSARTSDASVDGGRYACPEEDCDKTYKNPSGLARHAHTHKPDFRASWKNHCDQCEGVFLYPKDLVRHKKTHDKVPVRGFKCTKRTCRYHHEGFVRKDHLLRHHRKCNALPI
ncbi:hypothetical protein FKW77_008488 [Venturia effusa]|uniref:C2H2-type domain-containing protein n=1 Tax=Venturia effusa TaxID=50376 RepID=A0A517L1S7_9PEZI|nr:hypothetical protein FKW77_008488 [Venturia effusa]